MRVLLKCLSSTLHYFSFCLSCDSIQKTTRLHTQGKIALEDLKNKSIKERCVDFFRNTEHLNQKSELSKMCAFFNAVWSDKDQQLCRLKNNNLKRHFSLEQALFVQLCAMGIQKC